MFLQQGGGPFDRLGLVQGRKREPKPGRAKGDRRRADGDGEEGVLPEHRRRRQRRSGEPTITGTIGLSAGGRPSAVVKSRALSNGFLLSSSSSRMIRNAATAAAVAEGGSPVEKTTLRARFTSHSISSDEPQT